jgi:pimeloyl-ACP methyl ester carboxylesterase
MDDWDVGDVLLPGDRRLRVRRRAGTGAPLVLLHGLFDDSEGWTRVAGDTPRPCFAVDLPGFGGSSLPQRPRISAYAEDVVAGLEGLGIERCTLIGHSFGGAVAAAAAERSARIQSLILLAPAGFGHIFLAEAMTLPGVIDVAELMLPFALISPLTVTAAYTTFVAHNRLPTLELMTRLRRRAFSSARGVRAATLAIAHAGRCPRGFAHRPVAFGGAVAALWGEHDALVPVHHARAVRRALPQAHVEVWSRMGHHPQRERPDELATFIEAHAAASSERTPQRLRPAA